MELSMKSFKKLTKVLPKTGCWEYVGARDSQGYGRMFIGGKEYKAQRVAYMLERGPIPEKLRLRHFLPSGKCIGRACCNPLHLKLMDYFDSIAFPPEPLVRTCKAGHEISGDNVITETRPDGRVQTRCRICCQEKWKARKLKLKADRQKTAHSPANDER